ncbi:hypothetical protein [Streptomyces spongiicola]|uniref:hypothetical protein n=1 Tax=Streptomyces spongiicola TaxID=1690221 RepID=UPI000E2F9362|nr:hypothetical protein [Streptomyces spongiicola]
MSGAEQTPETVPGAPVGRRPGRPAAAAALCGFQALALFAGGLYMLVSGLTGDPESTSQAGTGGVTLIALGLIPLLAARGLLLGRGWSRGPAIITQIMALPVAWTLLRASGALIPAGILLAAVAVTALVLLLDPRTAQALGIRGRA